MLAPAWPVTGALGDRAGGVPTDAHRDERRYQQRHAGQPARLGQPAGGAARPTGRLRSAGGAAAGGAGRDAAADQVHGLPGPAADTGGAGSWRQHAGCTRRAAALAAGGWIDRAGASDQRAAERMVVRPQHRSLRLAGPIRAVATRPGGRRAATLAGPGRAARIDPVLCLLAVSEFLGAVWLDGGGAGRPVTGYFCCSLCWQELD